jgi:DNA-binding NarL/FixJ family response regulator
MKIIVADDHPIFRSGLAFLLQSSFSSITILSFENGAQVIDALNSNHPDLVLLDIDMPVLNGLETCLWIHENKPEIPVIILSIHKQEEMIKLAFFNGAKGYLIKDNTGEELVECIHSVRNNKMYLPKQLREQQLKNQSDGYDSIRQKLEELTPTEYKVLHLVSQKYSSKEIANLLFVSSKSVENYRSRICKKLDLDARNNSLALWAMEHKFLLQAQK